MTPVEEIKSKLSVEQLIGEYVTLKQSGTNFKGLCPFHQEKTPSFMVSPEKQIWHCFGCNEGGDIFTFIQKFDGVDFKGSIEMLAQKTGVTLTGFSMPDQSRKRVLFDAHAAAAELYRKHLEADAPASQKTREYLATRGLTPDTVKDWELGLASESWEDVLHELRRRKFTDDDIKASGLVIAREQKFFDRFRKRLMFPIHDAQGHPIAFTARTLQYIVYPEEEQAGKYVNSPQTPIYNKSHVLYGFHKAKQDIKRLDYAIIVEGNMDVIMSHQAGTRNTVAVSGTALTLEQLKLLKRYTNNIILSFDADTAGSQAVFRGITLAWEQDMNVKVIILKEGKDPAEIISHDKELWRTAIKESIGVVDFYFEAVLARVDLTRADHKKIAAQKITSIINKLKTKIEQAHYVSLLAERLKIPEAALWTMIAAPAIDLRVTEQPVVAASKTTSALGRHFLASIAQNPQSVMTAINEIEPEMLEGELQELYKKIIIQYTKEHSTNFRALSANLSQQELSLWSEIVFSGEQLYGDMPSAQQEQELQQLIRRIRRQHLSVKLRELTRAIRHAEQEGDAEMVQKLLTEFHAASSQHIP